MQFFPTHLPEASHADLDRLVYAVIVSHQNALLALSHVMAMRGLLDTRSVETLHDALSKPFGYLPESLMAHVADHQRLIDEWTASLNEIVANGAGGPPRA